MQIVIDIPDDFHKKVQDDYRLGNGDAVQIPIECIASGTPLPEHHGRLIDIDQLGVSGIDSTDLPLDRCLMCYLKEDVDNAPIIIEADDAEEFDNLDSMLEHLWNDTTDEESEVEKWSTKFTQMK